MPRSEFATVRTGRASPALVERLSVLAYGQEMPLQQLAGFQVPEARLLLITPYDRANLGPIEKAIQHSDLGLNPSNDGHSIRLAFPPLTQERRKELVKRVKHMAEDGRVAVRNARRDGRKHLDGLEKGGVISSDERRQGVQGSRPADARDRGGHRQGTGREGAGTARGVTHRCRWRCPRPGAAAHPAPRRAPDRGHQGAAAMDDENEPQTGRPPRPPARTEQLRIVGAEEAGALMGQADRRRPDADGPEPPGPAGRARRQRSRGGAR